MIQQLSPHNWNSIRNRSQRVCKVSSNHLIKTYAMHNYILKKSAQLKFLFYMFNWSDIDESVSQEQLLSRHVQCDWRWEKSGIHILKT